MKADHPETKIGVIPLLLLAASVAFGVLIYTKTTHFMAEPIWAEDLVKRLGEQNGTDSSQAKGAITRSSEMAEALKKENLFSPPIPKQNPVTAVLGILGDEALIGDKWYKAGDQVQDARIVAVEATQVRVEWDGKERLFAPLQATNQLEPGGARRSGRSAGLVPRPNSPAKKMPQRIPAERTSAKAGRPADDSETIRQKAEKQRLAAERKELQRTSRESAAAKTKRDKNKKNPAAIKKANERPAEKKAKTRPLK